MYAARASKHIHSHLGYVTNPLDLFTSLPELPVGKTLVLGAQRSASKCQHGVGNKSTSRASLSQGEQTRFTLLYTTTDSAPYIMVVDGQQP